MKDTIFSSGFFTVVIIIVILVVIVKKWGSFFPSLLSGMGGLFNAGIDGFNNAKDKAKEVSKWAGAFLVGALIGLYAAFVAMCYWNWFAVRALHIGSISYLEMVGIVWFIQLFQEKVNPNEEKWKVLFIAVDACIPADKKETVQEALQDYKDDMWWNTATTAFSRVVSLTVSLALGFGLNILIG